MDDIRYRLNLGVGVYSGGTMEVGTKVSRRIREVLNDFKEDHGRVRRERIPRLYHKCFP